MRDAALGYHAVGGGGPGVLPAMVSVSEAKGQSLGREGAPATEAIASTTPE